MNHIQKGLSQLLNKLNGTKACAVYLHKQGYSGVSHRETICTGLSQACSGKPRVVSPDSCECPGGKFFLGWEMDIAKVNSWIKNEIKSFRVNSQAEDFLRAYKYPHSFEGQELVFEPAQEVEKLPNAVVFLGVPENILRLIYLNIYLTGQSMVRMFIPLCSALSASLATNQASFALIDHYIRKKFKLRDWVGVVYPAPVLETCLEVFPKIKFH